MARVVSARPSFYRQDAKVAKFAKEKKAFFLGGLCVLGVLAVKLATQHLAA